MALRSRFGSLWTWVGAAVALALGTPAPGWAARPPASKLLPDKTVFYLSVSDARDMARRFQNTALGRMSQDPQLQPLLKQLYGSAADFIGGFKEHLGLSLPELLSIPQGEITVALVAPEEGPPVGVLLLDTGSQVGIARTLLQRGSDILRSAGATRSEENVSGTIMSIFDPPDGPDIRIAWFEKEGTIVAGSNPDVLRQILGAWDGRAKDALAASPKFSQIMASCRGMKGEQPQLFWFADPVALFRAIGQQNVGVQLAMMMVLRLGIDGFQGVGGSWALDCGSLDEVVHAHLLLESPRGGVLELIALEAGDNTPEPWVPADVADYTTFHWRLEATYKSLSKLIDSFQGDGAFANEMDRRFSKPLGVDLIKEILPALDGRITFVTWMEKPVTRTSRTFLLALRLKDPEVLSKAVETVLKKTNQPFQRKGIGGKEYYQVGESRTGPAGDMEFGLCVGVLDNYLVFTTRPGLYQKAVATLDTPDESLAKDIDFKLVASRISRRAGSAKPALIMFRRPEESYRFLYALVTGEDSRNGLRRAAERSGFMRTLNSALDANPLPPFSVLERYLAPEGAFIVDDATGLHYATFTLRRK
jgi:hypothetical protein